MLSAVPGWLDGLLFGALRTEAAWVANGGSFPAGQSLVLIARRR